MHFSSPSLLILGASSLFVFGEDVEPALGTYIPSYPVTDEAVIDLDQEALEDVAHSGDYDENTFNLMMDIYSEGGNSRPIGVVYLDESLPVRLEAGTQVQGFDFEGHVVEGTLAAGANVDATHLRIAYKVNSNHNNPGNCRGGLLPADRQVFDSCLDTEGTLLINGVDYSYSDHVPEEETVSGRPLQSLSVNTNHHRQNMDPASPYHDQMDMFSSYYGVPDYADRIIMSAFLDDVAGLQSGSVETQGQTNGAKANVVTAGTVLLNTFMMVISQLKQSVLECISASALQDEISGDSSKEVYQSTFHALGAAVAFYTGSLQQPGNDGNMLYSWAERLCADMNTCETSESRHNEILFSRFRDLHEAVGQLECEVADVIVEGAIIPQLYVPLIQGVLYYAFLQKEAHHSFPTAQATGAVFAASMLPLLHVCDEDGAELVYQNMRLGGDGPDFSLVKQTLEDNYFCMQVSCSMVGGVYDGENYYDGAEPCVDNDFDDDAPVQKYDDEVDEDDEMISEDDEQLMDDDEELMEDDDEQFMEDDDEQLMEDDDEEIMEDDDEELMEDDDEELMEDDDEELMEDDDEELMEDDDEELIEDDDEELMEDDDEQFIEDDDEELMEDDDEQFMEDDDEELTEDDDDEQFTEDDDEANRLFDDNDDVRSFLTTPSATQSAIIGVAAALATALLCAFCRCCLAYCRRLSSSKQAIVASSELEDGEVDLTDHCID